MRQEGRDQVRRTGPGECLLGATASPWKTWQRPTLPRLKTQYHWRGGVSRPSSGWIGWGTLAIATKSSKEMRSTTEVVRSQAQERHDGSRAKPSSRTARPKSCEAKLKNSTTEVVRSQAQEQHDRSRATQIKSCWRKRASPRATAQGTPTSLLSCARLAEGKAHTHGMKLSSRTND